MRRDLKGPLPGAPDPWAPSEMPPFRARPPYLMTEMIAAEPALADRLIHRLASDAAVDDLASAVREALAAGTPIVLTGCGTSEHAAAGIGELIAEAVRGDARHRIRSIQALDLAARPTARGLVIAVSHEGGTSATLAALRAARTAGARTALVTVGGGSPAAELADILLRTEEQDQSWCHTVGYLSPLVVGVALAARLAGTPTDALALHALLDVTADPHAAAAVAAGLAGTDRLLVAGAGVDEVSCRELALKVVEGARVPAAPLHLENVLHGHLAAATRWTGLVAVATDPATGTGLVRDRLAAALRAARTLELPTVAILGEEIDRATPADLTPAGRIVVPSTGRITGAAASLLGPAIPLQLLAERLARARGVDPDTLGREDVAQAAAHA